MLDIINEAIKSFRRKGDHALSDKFLEARSGEGVEELNVPYGVSTLSSFNLFYQNYIDKSFESEVQKIKEYRKMAEMPEIADIIEDVVVESTQENDDGEYLLLDIHSTDLEKNENAKKIIYDEFNNFFYNKLNMNEKLWDFVKGYVVDGRLFYERVITKGRSSDGIVNIKKLPAESMDFDYDPKTGRIKYFYQFLREGGKKPSSIEEAEKDKDIIVFHPEQIGYIDYGIYGKNRKDIKGYLDKVKVPFNQLKLLETSIVIYRIVRAPERLVHKIDVGSMPKDKAFKYVEKIKNSMNMKQAYDSATGRLSNEPALLCIRKNTEIPLLDGRFLTLEEVVKEFKEGKENWVYTINQETHNIEPGKIEKAAITRLNEDLVRVYLDNGSYIDTTHDHKFILRDGSEKRADLLEKDEDLMKNHSVARIEFLDEKDDTGCITVNKNHNFAVSQNGKTLIFIKNSLLHNYYLPQCLSLKTRINIIPNGESTNCFYNLTLSQLIEDFEKGIKHQVYSHDTLSGRTIIGDIVWAGITRKNADMLRIHLNTGEIIDCTPDHKFVLMNGSEIEAEFLKPNMPIVPFIDNFVKYAIKIDYLEEKEDTGCITVEDINGNHNFALECGVFVKNSSDGRGSDITSIQGNFEALKVLDDLYYFQKKVYRALRYPISRIQSRQERGEEPMFGGRTMAEISRDEIKWAKFLERKVQIPFANELLDLFLLHMEFKGLKKEYELNRDNLSIRFNDPSFYKSQQQQMFLETKTENYLKLANNMEFSKTYLMKKYLGWSDEEIEENMKAMKEDKSKLTPLLPDNEMQMGGGGGMSRGSQEEPASDEDY
jgi:hypothetical protein